jgi:hypothetical protein
VTYTDSESARRACEDPMKLIDGRKAIAKLATDGLEENKKRQQQQMYATATSLSTASMIAQQPIFNPYLMVQPSAQLFLGQPQQQMLSLSAQPQVLDGG